MEDMRMHRVARQLVMVDETSKDDWTIYRHYGRAPAGHRTTIHANFVRGDRYCKGTLLSSLTQPILLFPSIPLSLPLISQSCDSYIVAVAEP